MDNTSLIENDSHVHVKHPNHSRVDMAACVQSGEASATLHLGFGSQSSAGQARPSAGPTVYRLPPKDQGEMGRF
jgi:hypothetical protein